MQWQAAALTVCLLLTAGCSGFAEFERDEPATVTPVPVPPEDTRPMLPPPGVTASGLGNVNELAVAHRTALENRSFTLEERYVRIEQLGTNTSTVRHNETTNVGGDGRYHNELTRKRTFTDGQSIQYSQSTYGTATGQFMRAENGQLTNQTGTSRLGREQFAFETSFYLQQYLPTTDSRAAQVIEDETLYFRVVGVGGKPRWAALLERTQEYRVTLLVDSNGLVHEFHVRYRTENETVRHSFWFETIDSTTVETPEWMQEADAKPR